MSNLISSIDEARRVSRKMRPSRKWHPMRHTTEPRTCSDSEQWRGVLSETWMNHLYAVNVWRQPLEVMLGIFSLDGEARHDWRDFQCIKNDIVGPEWEAVELYPAESRLIDPSNYYYLWARPSFKEIGKTIGRQIIHPAKAFAPQRGWHQDDEPPMIVQTMKGTVHPKTSAL